MNKWLVLVFLVLLCPPLSAEERVWGQEAAKKKVQAVLELERQGQPWNKIPWLTNVQAAEEAAKRANKPLFVFLYIKKPVGPKDAQC